MKNKTYYVPLVLCILPVFPMGYQQSTTYYDKTADETCELSSTKHRSQKQPALTCLFHLSHSHRYVHEKYSYKSQELFSELLLAACDDSVSSPLPRCYAERILGISMYILHLLPLECVFRKQQPILM